MSFILLSKVNRGRSGTRGAPAPYFLHPHSSRRACTPRSVPVPVPPVITGCPANMTIALDAACQAYARRIAEAPGVAAWIEEVQKDIIEKKLKFYVINGYDVAEQTGMGGRMNTIMQTAFFAISGILPREAAIAEIKHSIEKTYGKRGEAVVKKNFEAVDATIANLYEVKVPAEITSKMTRRLPVPAEAPEFVRNVLGEIIGANGDNIPVSAFPIDGTFPTGTTQWEKRNIGLESPVWDEKICIQCGKCVMVCPHAVIRHKVYDEKLVANAPETFKHTASKFKEFSPGYAYTVQVAPEDCTGCTLCVEVCPEKNCLSLKVRKFHVTPLYSFALAVLALFAIFYLIAVLTGNWHTNIQPDVFRHLYPSAGSVAHP